MPAQVLSPLGSCTRSEQQHRTPSPRPFPASAQLASRRSPRPSMPTLPPVPSPTSLVLGSNSAAPTPATPYASMIVPSVGYFERQEMADHANLNQRNYKSLADTAGFDSVVLKQRESDRVLLGKFKDSDYQFRQASPPPAVKT